MNKLLRRNQFFVLLLLIFAGIYILARQFYKDLFPSPQEIVEILRNSGFIGPILFIALSAIRGLLLFPPNATMFLMSGLVFGPVYGAVYALLGGLVCAIFEFGIARCFGLPMVKRIIGGTRTIPDVAPFTSISSISLFRLVMFGPPFDLINYGFGLTNTHWSNYLIGTTIGLIPSAILFTRFGYSLDQSPSIRLVVITSIITLIAAIILFWRYRSWFWEKYRDDWTTQDNQTRVMIAIGEPFGVQLVTFPKHQQGFSTFIGYFKFGEKDYILKLLRTQSIGKLGYVRKILSKIPMKDNIFTPSQEIYHNILLYIKTFDTRLREVTREDAFSALNFAFDFARKNPIQIKTILEDLFQSDYRRLDFFPSETKVTFATNPFEEYSKTIAIIQEDVSGSYMPPNYYSIDKGSNTLQSRYDAYFLVIAALAVRLVNEYQIGLDLFPHIKTIKPIQLYMPNLIRNPTTDSIYYVDVIGIFSSRGNIIQRAGNWLLYSKNGLVACLASNIFSRLCKYNLE